MGIDMNHVVGRCDLLLITLDTLRFDVAQQVLQQGRLPTLARHLPAGGWEERHSPGNFTFSAHSAIFAGFMPTPARPGRHPRLFAMQFPGSETTDAHTCVLQGTDLVDGLRRRGYHSVCIGGVGFFNKQTPLGRTLPRLFDESHWAPQLGVTDPESTANQVRLALEILARQPATRRLLLFINVSALHQPNRFYLPGARKDSLATHAAALAYVDGQLAPLLRALERRGPTFCMVLSDHGTAYGEEGYSGHRLGHPVVWSVPYAQFMLGQAGGEAP